MSKELDALIQCQERYEELIEGISQRSYGKANHFFDKEVIAGLRNNLLSNLKQGKMHPAGIGKKFSYAKNLKVRGDLICWIDKNSADKYEQTFNNQITDFIQYLNQTCYTGINDFEFHYAFYEKGSFYKRHTDQFKTDFGRKFSLVTYLNESWEEEDAGQLVLHLGQGAETILPAGGTAVCFKSDEVEHEVIASGRDRMSIAGWLKGV